MKVIFRPAAHADLDKIYDTTVQMWGPEQAEHYLAQIRVAVDRLLDHPQSGSRYPAIEYVRSIPSGRHLIFYSLSPDTITVIRVLHDRMDIRAKLIDN